MLQSQEKLEVVAVGICQNGFGTLRSVVKEDVLWRGSVSLTPSSSPWYDTIDVNLCANTGPRIG